MANNQHYFLCLWVQVKNKQFNVFLYTFISLFTQVMTPRLKYLACQVGAELILQISTSLEITGPSRISLAIA